MAESKLGDVFMEKAGQYPDASMEAMVYMDICGACNLFIGDRSGTVSDVLDHFEKDCLPRLRSIANNPARGEAMRKYWTKKVELFEQALEELKTSEITN